MSGVKDGLRRAPGVDGWKSPTLEKTESGKIYALLVDVAGEDEALELAGTGETLRSTNPRRDSTAVTVVEIVPPPGGGLVVQSGYKVVQR